MKKKVIRKPGRVGLFLDPSIPLAVSLWWLLTVVTLHPAGVIGIPAERPDALGATRACKALPRPPDFLLEQVSGGACCAPLALSPACGDGDAAGAWLLEGSPATDMAMLPRRSDTPTDVRVRSCQLQM